MDHEHLRWRRAGLGLSQAQFGHMIGHKQAVISRWESGARPIPHWVSDRILDGEDIRDAAYAGVGDVIDSATESDDANVPSVQLHFRTVDTDVITPQTSTLRAGAGWAIVEHIGEVCAMTDTWECTCGILRRKPPVLAHTMDTAAPLSVRWGDTMHTWRVALGLTQHQLATISGVPQSTVATLETGKRAAPSPKVLAGLHVASCVAHEAFVGHIENPGTLPCPDDDTMSTHHPDAKKRGLPAVLGQVGWSWARYDLNLEKQD